MTSMIFMESGEAFIALETVSEVGDPRFDGIDASGLTDVTAQIQAIIDGTADNATLQFPSAAAVYGIDGTLNVNNRTGMTFVANGTQLVQITTGPSGAARSFWQATSSTGITWNGFTMVGANANAGTGTNAYDPNREHQHGWALTACTNMTIENNNVSKIYGDFVYLQNLPTGLHTLCDTISVTGNTFNANGRQGVSITGANNVTYDSNTITNIRQTVLDLEPSSQYGVATNVTFSNNTVGPFRQQFVAGTGGTPGVAMSNIAITGNNLTDPNGQGALKIVFGRSEVTRTNLTITNNTAATSYNSSGGYLIGPVNVNGVTVTGNTQPFHGTPAQYLVGQHNCTSVTVSGNTIPGATGQLETV